MLNYIRSSLRSQVSDIKILLLGNKRAGKSCLVKSWIVDDFSDEAYSPTVYNHYNKEFWCENKMINVSVIDTAGSFEFPSMDKLYIQKSDVIFLIYETGDIHSIESTKSYLSYVRNELGDKDVTLCIVGTKSDKCENMFNGYEDDASCELFSLFKHFVISSKEKNSVNLLFEFAIRSVAKKRAASEPTKTPKKEQCHIM